MKRMLVVLLIFLLGYADAFTQKDIIFECNDLCLSITINEYTMWKNDPADTIGDAINEPYTFSAGHVCSNDSMIICYDTIKFREKKLEFKKLDAYRLKVCNTAPFFKPGDMFYAKVISDSIGRPTQYLSWKDGKPHGLWVYFSDKGANYVLYENGSIIKEYFKTNEEIYRDSFKISH